jgi:L-seryl-tRNA(Ser) seleniumtransferase
MPMKKNIDNGRLRRLPSVERVLQEPATVALIGMYGRPLVTYAVRRAVADARRRIGRKSGDGEITAVGVTAAAEKIIRSIAAPSLKPVVNATGIVLHTNLGRAPLGETILREIAPLLTGYTNVEFDLDRGDRGDRNAHVAELLRYLTGAEEVAVVNNNAAALILSLHTLARDREVLISRGELIEIGGEFRIPDIMAAAGVRMVEVGTTNRTRLSDYEKAITSGTALIVKAHRSNFTMAGFTEEVSIGDLAALARAKKLPFLYDIGSGLLRRPSTVALPAEPDVRTSLAQGAALVAFSCDKLLGGPQAGVIAGKRDLVRACLRSPLMRALRVGKLTIAALAAACRGYLDEKELLKRNVLFSILERSLAERRLLADTLAGALARRGIAASVVESFGQAGGGTLPDLRLPSFAVAVESGAATVKQRETFAERLFKALLRGDRPVAAILREGKILLDVFALAESEIDPVAARVAECLGGAAAP